MRLPFFHLPVRSNWRRGLVVVVALLSLRLSAQYLWNALPPSLSTQNLWSIAYGNVTLVAVGEQGTVLSQSYADLFWWPRASGTDAWLVGVGFGAGRFVIVGDRGTILTSDDDGVTWTPRPSGTTVRLNAAVYGNGRWLVAGEQGTVLTSTDGTTWSVRPALGRGFLRALAYGRGQFLIGGGGGALFSTTDAATFTAVPIATTADIEGAAISANYFFLVGSGGLRAVATQLGSWTITVSSSGQTLRGIAVHTDDDATAVGDREALTNHAGAWGSTFYPPPFFATAIVHGLNELVAVGFGGSVARSDFSSPNFIVGEPFPNVVYGGEARFKLFTDEVPLSYQWTRDGAEVAGATTAEFVLRNLAASASVGAKYTTGGGARTVAPTLINVVPGGRPEVRDAGFSSALPVVPTLVVPQADGKLLVAGSFSVPAAGGPTYGLARLNADGSIDAGFRAGAGIAATSSINGIVPLADGRIYVWGSFTAIAGQARPGIARLMPNGALDAGFSPDVSLPPTTKIAPTPDGRLYFQTGVDSYYLDSSSRNFDTTISRLASDGSRDPAFAPLVGYKLVGVDPQGRVLAVTVNTSPQNLVRLVSNGTRDNSYTATPVNIYFGATGGANDLAVTLLTNAGLYVASESHSRFFSNYTFSRIKPDGGRDPGYQSPPPLNAPTSGASANQYSFGYGPDGSLWSVHGTEAISNVSLTSTFRAEFYTASGAADPGKYGTLPELSFFRILAVAPGGTLLSSVSANSAKVTVLIRLRPIVGRVGRLTNLSVRAFVTSANEPLIAGFVTTGIDTTSALVRAIGPGLVQFGLDDAMTDPLLALTRDGAPVGGNDNWDPGLAPRFAKVGAFPLAAGSKDAALESAVGAGNYTAVVTPAAADRGTGLVELYESADGPLAPRRFVNVSARGPVTDTRPLIVGFTVTGDVPLTVLIRAAGPALNNFGVVDALPNPLVTLFRADSRLGENNDWAPFNTDYRSQVMAAERAGAFPFAIGSNDAAMLVTLSPGGYTAQVSGVNGATGVALVEVYEVP